MGRKCVWSVVAFFAVICCAFGSRECGEERVTVCKEKLLDILFGDFTEEEACEQLYGVSTCLRNVVNDCLGEEEHAEVEQSLKEFKDFLDENCAGQSLPEGDTGDESEASKCLERNQDHLLDCIIDSETGEISQLLQPESIPDGIAHEFRQCYLYGVMAHCVVSRAEERCGVAGGEEAADQLSTVPISVKKSCESHQVSVEDSVVKEFFEVNLLDKKKKRALQTYRKKRQVEYRKKRSPQDWLPMTFSGKR